MTVHESELTWLSTRELAARIATGELSAREALTDQLARIDSVNPALNAIVTRDDERAYDRAKLADEGYARGEPLGLLHGVPLTHKESTDTAGLRTTRGSPLLADNVPTQDALIIARLHAAGVIMSGKSNVPEFTAGSHTFNPLFGTTVNPYDTTKSAAGSSGGAAAAIAAGIQASGDGSDMGGSLRTPGSFNNIVGMRPSNGRIPHALPADPWKWLAQPGFMARTASDVALLMAAASGPASGAPQSISEPGSVFIRSEFSAPDDHEPGSALASLRIGFSTDLNGLIPVESVVADVVGAAADVFAAAGSEIDDALPDLRDADEVFRVVRALDFVSDYRAIVRSHRAQVKDTVVWNTELGLALTVDEIVSAEAARVRLQGAIESFFAHHDLLVLTASQVAPFDARIEYPRDIDDTPMRDYLDWMRAATIISATGCPAISVPGGFTPEGLPVGIQLVAAPGKDVDLLLAAQGFEELTGHHGRHPEIVA
ncbi:amidase [Microbacterium murale]|uniref:Amidase n=1 Tax=Microbacterium murale TaxID=1081040 RepID=A0ABU0P5X7_9MICO|nr:amidase family protein [Microbacterium murale]MDQ0642724.1 amidase [Microbacterium murale]